MYWLSLLIDPITGARIKHAYDPRFRKAWHLEKQLDRTVRRVPKQLAGDIIANMLLGLPAIYDLHPQAQADADNAETEPRSEPEAAAAKPPFGFGEPAPTHQPGNNPSSDQPAAHGSPSESPSDLVPTPATASRTRGSDRSNTPDHSGGHRGVRFVEVGKDADGNETRTDLGTYTPIRPTPLFEPPPDTEGEPVRPDIADSGGTCSSCRTSGSPPTESSPPPPTDASSDGPGSRNRGRPRADVNIVIGLSDLNDLADRQAVGYTSDGVPIPATAVRALMCDAEISCWVEQADSHQLSLARTVRYATPIQRQALLVRDGCCVWKHCTMPASASEAHHITFWEHGGNTDLEHLCLLCPAHHRKLHAMGAHIKPGPQSRQWYLTRDSDSQTVREWTNPPHRQKPGSNTKPNVA